MRSPRAVIETLVSNSAMVLPRLTEILPSRDPGNELSLGDPGPRPALPALAARLLRLATRAEREGAKGFEQEQRKAGADGTGAESLMLARGCHELTLLSDATPSSATVIDLDAELLDGESGALLAVDRAEDADAALSVCLGDAHARRTALHWCRRRCFTQFDARSLGLAHQACRAHGDLKRKPSSDGWRRTRTSSY